MVTNNLSCIGTCFSQYIKQLLLSCDWTILNSLSLSLSLSLKLAHKVYIEKTEISMVAWSRCSSIRTFRICLSQNWKTTRNQFGWKCLQTKPHFVTSWYRPPGSTSEEFQPFREQLDYIRTRHKGKTLPSVHVLCDFNFKDIDWPSSKSGSTLSQSEGQYSLTLWMIRD